MMRSSVDFPHPDGPSRATNSPAGMSRSRLRIASTLPGKTRLTPRTATRAAVSVAGEAGASMAEAGCNRCPVLGAKARLDAVGSFCTPRVLVAWRCMGLHQVAWRCTAASRRAMHDVAVEPEYGYWPRRAEPSRLAAVGSFCTNGKSVAWGCTRLHGV